MNIKIFEFNPVRENTYILSDETQDCVIIDPGCYNDNEKFELTNYIESNNLTVKHILNTHLHFDHIFGSNFVESKYDLQTQAHKADEFLIENLSEQLAMFGFPPMNIKPTIGRNLTEGDVIFFGNQKLIVLEVPGHSPGSIAFYNKDAKYIISGDALFRLSIGRTDLPLGDLDLLVSGIKQKLFTLPPETTVYPGHGPKTTIGDEIKSNPFFQ